MNDREKVIKGLEFTKAMITFNPSTGEDIEPENLNEADKTTYDACVGAITLLKEQCEQIETQKENFASLIARLSTQPEIVRCKDCTYYEPFMQSCNIGDGIMLPDFYCANAEPKEGQ